MIKKESSFYLDCMRSIWVSKIDSSEVNLSEEKENYIEISSLREDNHPNLKKIKNINFLENESINDEKNEFKKINSNNTEYPFLVFENCVFKDFEVANYKKELHFINCIFENITLKNRFDNIIFEDCTINDKFIITNYLSLKDQKLSAGNNVIAFYRGSINELILYGLINFEHRLYINHQSKKNNKTCKIKSLRIEACSFLENFKLQNTIIDEIEISDVNFEKNVDFYKTIFKNGISYDLITNKKSLRDEIRFLSINFSGMALFTNSRFEQKFIMEHVTFEKMSNFKNAIFEKGFDLEQINIKEEINFYGIEILDKTTTSQETYRILKHNFEEVNNKIEANKYHALEMELHRKDIWSKEYITFKLLSDGIVSFIHWLSSNHSSNWFLALFWIFVVSFITTYNLECKITIDNIFKYINVLSDIEDFKDSYMAMTLNKVSLGYLYYQFLTAVRKDTRK